MRASLDIRHLLEQVPFLRNRAAFLADAVDRFVADEQVPVSPRNVLDKAAESAPQILIVVLAFAAMLSLAWLNGRENPGRELSAPDVAMPSPPIPDRYRGMVQLAPDRMGQCARFAFDNRTGLIQPQPSSDCENDVTATATATVPAPPAGTAGRMNAIRDYFKH
jgi:hypothetical protein